MSISEPHEIIMDALRYFATYWALQQYPAPRAKENELDTRYALDDYYNGDIRVKERMLEVYGEI